MNSMKQGILSLLLATFCTSFAVAAELNDIPAEERERIAEMFDSIDPGDVFTSPVDGWYTIQKGSIVAYITSDGRYLLQGDLIDLDSQVNMTEATRSNARRDLMSSVESDETIVFSPEDVKYTVSIFTDIDCSYCRRLHSQIDGYLAEGIEVRYFLYPRGGPASRSWNTSEDVWCSKDRGDALTQAKLDREFETSKCDASTVSDHYVMGQQVGLSGTPAIVLGDGELIGGYLPPNALRQRLDQKAAVEELH